MNRFWRWRPAFLEAHRSRKAWLGLLRFMLAWPVLALLPALLAYLIGAFIGAWLLRGLDILTLDFWMVFRNVFHDRMIFGGAVGDLIHGIPDAGGFVTLGIGTVLAGSWAYRTPLMSWITAAPRFRWRLVVWGFACCAAVFAGGLVLQGVISHDGYHPDFGWAEDKPRVIAFYLTVSVLVTVLQSSAEEVLFRGSLMRQGWMFVRNGPVIIVLSASAFALAHRELDPPRLLQLFLAGLAFAWVAMRSGGIEWSMGMHAAWNLAFDFITDRSDLSLRRGDHLGVVSQWERFATEWAVFLVLPLLLIVTTELVLRAPRLRAMVDLNSNAAAEPGP